MSCGSLTSCSAVTEVLWEVSQVSLFFCHFQIDVWKQRIVSSFCCTIPLQRGFYLFIYFCSHFHCCWDLNRVTVQCYSGLLWPDIFPPKRILLFADVREILATSWIMNRELASSRLMYKKWIRSWVEGDWWPCNAYSLSANWSVLTDLSSPSPNRTPTGSHGKMRGKFPHFVLWMSGQFRCLNPRELAGRVQK